MNFLIASVMSYRSASRTLAGDSASANEAETVRGWTASAPRTNRTGASIVRRWSTDSKGWAPEAMKPLVAVTLGPSKEDAMGRARSAISMRHSPSSRINWSVL